MGGASYLRAVKAPLPDIELVTPDEPAFRPANFVSGYEHLPVRFTPTAPLG